MSEVKVNKVSPRSGTGVQLGDSGDTFTLPSGGTLTVASGATINNQGTAVNFGATGSASWTSTVKTATFTAVAGEGYFCNTTAGSFTVNLPAGSVGAVVAVKDYASTFQTNNLTLAPNGSDKIGSSTDDVILTEKGIALTLVFIDSTQGWLVTDSGLQAEATRPYNIDFLVIAGGGGAGTGGGGGGGAGGYRASFNSEASGGGGSSESAIQGAIGTQYTITVGAGGAASVGTPSPAATNTSGVDSSIAASGMTTITSTGGGKGANGANFGGGPPGADYNPATGGSGGGAGMNNNQTGAAGTSTQGFAGGDCPHGGSAGAGGGGGAGAVGGTGTTSPTDDAGNGGVGVASTITGSSVTRGGGGGGGTNGPGEHGIGGAGGGGAGSTSSSNTATSGTANTGGGGGGGWYSPNRTGGAGGSGVVILSMPDANYSGTTTGSPTVATGVSGKTVLTFTGDGSYTA